MKTAFNTVAEINEPSKLFGRELIMHQLVSLANRRSCVQVIGCKRIGKTSLLKCLATHFKKIQSPSIYPVYLDIKEACADIKGTSNVYRFLISKLLATLSEDDIFTDSIKFREHQLVPSRYWESNFEKFCEIKDIQLPGFFEELICFFSDLIDRTFLFLFDEYEYLFKYCFDQPTGFMKLRNLASKVTANGFSPFIFYVAGNATWEKLCSVTGSGEMNCIDSIVRVTPIEYEHFADMWKNETRGLSNCPVEILDGYVTAFDASGGIPFYGKLIGAKWLFESRFPNHFDVNSHLSELYNSLENEEKDILLKLCNGDAKLPSSQYVFELRDNGLIKQKGNMYKIKFEFFRNYIKSLQVVAHSDAINQLPESFRVTDEITSIIYDINKTRRNKNLEYIFEPLNEDQSLYKDLRIPCASYEQFVNFSCSLYRIVFEKTKEGRTNKKRLPNEFKSNNQFIEIVDIMRHTLGKGHLEEKLIPHSGQMSKREMLRILTGSFNEPSAGEDFLSLQIKTLIFFRDELIKLKSIVER